MKTYLVDTSTVITRRYEIRAKNAKDALRPIHKLKSTAISETILFADTKITNVKLAKEQ